MGLETKNKIKEAFELSLEIPGSTFYHMSELGITRVYKIVDGEHQFEYECISISKIDTLIESLKKHINENI